MTRPPYIPHPSRWRHWPEVEIPHCERITIADGHGFLCSHETLPQCSAGTKYVELPGAGGSISPTDCCPEAATLLCDYATAIGATCDRPICEACAVRVGDEDWCPHHPAPGPVEPGELRVVERPKPRRARARKRAKPRRKLAVVR